MEETILSKIHDEHNDLFNMIDLIETTDSPEEKLRLFKIMETELVEHMHGEENSIYKRLREDIAQDNAMRLVNSSDIDHHQIREFLQRLNLMELGCDEWANTLSVLKSILKTHCDGEELYLFEEAKEDFSTEELAEILSEYEEEKHHL